MGARASSPAMVTGEDARAPIVGAKIQLFREIIAESPRNNYALSIKHYAGSSTNLADNWRQFALVKDKTKKTIAPFGIGMINR